MSVSKKIILSLAAALAVLLAAEFILGWYFKSMDGGEKSRAGIKRKMEQAAQFPGTNVENSFGHFKIFSEILHPYLGYVRDQALSTSINEFGWQGNHSPLQKKKPGKLIVGVTGGSVAEAFAVQGATAIARELSRLPRYQGKEIVIVCLALGGYKQPQQLMALAYLYTLGAEFDILINIDGFNEVALSPSENIVTNAHPAFPRSWSGRVVNHAGPEILKEFGRVALVEGTRAKLAAVALRLGIYKSQCAGLVWMLRDRQLTHRRDTLAAKAQALTGDPNNHMATGPRYNYQDENAVYADLGMIWKRSSHEIRALCQGNNTLYYHFLQPNQYVAGSKPMGAKERAVAISESHPYRLPAIKGYPVLKKLGEELKAEGENFQDLTMIYHDRPEPLYIDACCHVNQEGLELLAQRIGAEIGKKTE